MVLVSLESGLRVLAIIFYSGIAVYFYRKYKKDEIIISLYWMGTFLLWALGSVVALGIYLATEDNFLASDYFALFLALGVGVIASSTIEFEIISLGKRPWYLIVGVITILACLFTFDLEWNLFVINKGALLILVLLVPVPYLYLAYQGRDLRLALVTAALFLLSIFASISTSSRRFSLFGHVS